MQERAWVKDFFTRWQKRALPQGDDRAFYILLRKFHPESLLINHRDLQEAKPESAQDALLVELWRAWNDAVQVNPISGVQRLKKLAKKNRDRHEPFVLIGAASILRQDRAFAYKALQRALKLSNNDQQIALLIKRLGIRQSPVLPFLERGNPVNIALGKARAKLIT